MKTIVFLNGFISCWRIVIAYRYTVLEGTKLTCNDNNELDCMNATTASHSFCMKEISAMCQNFQSLEIDGFVKRHILNGHNGLRNRFSKEYKVPNMNILHWDNDLAEMARGWVSQCTQRSDPLNYICSANFTVGQNTFFSSKKPKRSDWVITTLRSWYSEGQLINRLDWNQYVSGNLSVNHVKNFAQLMWADTEFVGCAAAKMFNGYFAVCNYHPQSNHSMAYPLYVPSHIGPCSRCSDLRASCSRLFVSLCGIDNIDNGVHRHATTFQSLSSIIFVMFTFILSTY